jgi:hypothetical protein
MKKEHMHDWQPAWDLGAGRYRCVCGRTGFRYGGGEIKTHKVRARPERDWNEREPHTGAIPAAPTLDVYDRAPRG